MSYIDFDRNFTISNNNNKEYFVENIVERMTDRIVLEKTPCTFDNQKVKTWEDFFKYLNDRIVEEMKDGYYGLELKLPKDLFVRYNNALKVIIKFLIFKGFKIDTIDCRKNIIDIRWESSVLDKAYYEKIKANELAYLI